MTLSPSLHRFQTTADLKSISAGDWDALVRASCGRLHPALRYAFLVALQDTGCAVARTGWAPCFLLLWRGEGLAGAVPLYQKYHSYGEYVFDWAWAEAYHRHGLDYYPKLLAALPFTPVSAPKLLAIDAEARALLARELVARAKDNGLSSLHVLFPTESESVLLAAEGCLLRSSVQFHWRNPGVRSFADYLSLLTAEKRKKVRAERRKVAEAGVEVVAVQGTQASESDWAFFTHCYYQTYYEHGSTPYLNGAFFLQIAETMGEQLLLVRAVREGHPVAASLSLFDESVLYGRYWGTVARIPALHFEACYYTPMDFCIERRIGVFEGGAQGEHKLARGFEPVRLHSAHWLAHPAFYDAVANYLQSEQLGVESYLSELADHLPFRSDAKARVPDGPALFE